MSGGAKGPLEANQQRISRRLMKGSFILRARWKGLWLWRRVRTKYPLLYAFRRRMKSATAKSTQFLAARYRGPEAGVNPANITWMFSVGRSGSTWLSDMMGELSGHKVWMEPGIGKLFGEFYAKAPERKRRSAHFIMGTPTRKAWISSMRNFVLVGARHAFPLLRPEHHLIIKDLGGGVGAPLLMEALPESRMILLVRDPRDIVASWRAAASKGGWKRRKRRAASKRRTPTEKRPDGVQKLARNYRNILKLTKQAYDAHRGPKTLVLYEDLRVDTLEVMRRLYSDLGIAVDETKLARAVEKHAWENIPEDMKGEGKFFRKATPGGWREDLTPEQAKMVERIASPVVAEFYARRLAR
jgi:hypothetical protein